MAKLYILLPEARRDLRHITSYIAVENPTAAEKMKSKIMVACVKLGEYPYMGQERMDLTKKPVRFLAVHRNYMIIYNANTNPVQILRIYHSAMDVEGVYH